MLATEVRRRPAPNAAPPAMAVRTRALVEGPIVPTLLRLAAPNVAVMMMLALVSTADAYWIGRLGPDALAGVSLVFPLLMLMQTMSAGVLAGGPLAYRAMGGRGGALDAAQAYSLVIFAGATAPWLFNTLGSVVRGTGNMAVPALTMVITGALQL